MIAIVAQTLAISPTKLSALSLTLFIIALLTHPVYSSDLYPVKGDRAVQVTMRDGVRLAADVYRPGVPGKFPVLLHRTPYNRSSSSDFPPPFAFRAASQGYVVVMQDVRGRFESEGEWYPFQHEEQDGYDTVEWAAQLPYSDGRVAMFGASYVGVSQMLAAVASPPHLVALFPSITASDYHENWVYQGGAFVQGFMEFWTSQLAQDTLTRRVRFYTQERRYENQLPLTDYPLFDIGGREGLAPYFTDWLMHPSNDAYWKRWSIERRYAKISVPAYHVGGWYDMFLGGTLRNYVGIKKHGANEAARHNQRLIVGPWYHRPAPFDGNSGDVDFGPSAFFDQSDLALRWFDYVLKGEKNGLQDEKPVKIFVMGENVWRQEDDWPLARAKPTRLFLNSGGNANSASGDGMLSLDSAHQEASDQYVYYPAEPIPTLGPARDQRAVEARPDVLVYSGEPLAKDVEVTGPVSLELYVSSSAYDTDFTAKLVDVAPTGFALNLTDGILRCRYRNSTEQAELLTPGATYKITVDMWATSNVFKAGHRIRLEVASSNFPRFERNLNTGEEQAASTRMVKATNKVFHGPSHPSALILPIVPR
jgi:uncharacterized protein